MCGKMELVFFNYSSFKIQSKFYKGQYLLKIKIFPFKFENKIVYLIFLVLHLFFKRAF